MMAKEQDFTVQRLGECRFPSPMHRMRFTREDERMVYLTRLDDLKPYLDKGEELPTLELAGPREKIFFNPSDIACGIVTCGGLCPGINNVIRGIVTCGGLCPGINNVIRGIVLSLHHHYGVTRIYGFRYGFEGLVQRFGHTPLELDPEAVDRIGELGGTILASSRGPQEPAEMLDTLERMKVGILFAIGGDGTLKGAGAIATEAMRRKSPISVIGIPKTIDNDISFIQSTFGFETAVSEAQRAIYAAHTEALGARNGVGLVKLMGRDSGFIAAFSALVQGQVNLCLVPEVPFSTAGFLKALEDRLDRRGHAVIAVAEGAGQELMTGSGERDASGNVKYGDIGIFLRDTIKDHFKRSGKELNLKYIDPSYIIRSQPANAHDSALCLLFGHNAVHAGMAGKTNMVIGFSNHQFTHIPIPMATCDRKKIDPEGLLWNSVLASTGQPARMY